MGTSAASMKPTQIPVRSKLSETIANLFSPPFLQKAVPAASRPRQNPPRHGDAIALIPVRNQPTSVDRFRIGGLSCVLVKEVLP
jgi:hypothetical protein